MFWFNLLLDLGSKKSDWKFWLLLLLSFFDYVLITTFSLIIEKVIKFYVYKVDNQQNINFLEITFKILQTFTAIL